MAQRVSKRSRKRHVQQKLFRRGGKRRGAGRKPKGARAGERHAARPAFKPCQPLHIVARVVPAVGSLRRRAMYKALRNATITAALREQFRIVHISLQRTHVHLIVEAEHRMALARGMQGFLISAARHVNAALGDGVRRRCGQVFADRYHAEVIMSPTQARHTISYVLMNASHCTPWERGRSWSTKSSQTPLLRSTIPRFYRDDSRFAHAVLNGAARRALADRVDLSVKSEILCECQTGEHGLLVGQAVAA